MARHLMMKRYMTAITIAVILILSANGSLPVNAQARVPAPQNVPVISLDTPPARDAQTFETDKTLNAACRKTGQEKSICLCVTHILKYELTLTEYQATARLYGQNVNRAAVREVLKSEGISMPDIDMAEDMERSLVKDDDFALRCSEAKAYYKKRS